VIPTSASAPDAAPVVAFRKIRAVSDPQKPAKTASSAVRRLPGLAQLNLALLVLDSDYHFFKIQQVFALQLLQLETNLFGLVGLIESDYK
jgi:hypothetical protein